MEDQTTTISRKEVSTTVEGPPKAINESDSSLPSHIMQISIRGWIALLITITFCSASILKIPLDDTMKITVTAVISLYFGQNQKK